MLMKPQIVVIGSSNTDMVIKVPHLPIPGETVLGNKFQMINGGKGANQAIAAARAGGDVILLACMGNDNFGKNALELMREEGIDTSNIKIDNSESSGVAMINVASTGENSISVAPGANSLLLPRDIEKSASVLQKADIILMQLEIPLETVYKSIEIASKYKVPIILNPAPARKMDLEQLKLVDYITPNRQEALELAAIENTNIENEDLIAELKLLGLNTVIITLGEQGVLYSGNNQFGFQEGNKVNVIDTTAAGDTFNGYLAVFLAKGEKLDNAVRIANRAASLSVTRLGATTSIPYIKEIANPKGFY
jgi:ribokinase